MIWILVLAVCFNSLFILFAYLDWNTLVQSLQDVIFYRVLGFTIFQGAVSAVCSVAMGIVAAPGYARLACYWRKPIRGILLFPNMMSPVIVVLSLILTINRFPYGFWGIIIGHVFLNCGLATIWLGEAWLDLESRWRAVALVSGAKSWSYIIRIILPLLKNHILSTLGVIFSLCISSFAIPLVLGGGPQYSTLEVLIFEKIQTQGDVRGAVTLGFLQCLIQLALFAVILRPMLLNKERRLTWNSKSGPSSWSLVTLVVAGFSFWPVLILFWSGIDSLASFSANLNSEVFISAFKTTLEVSIFVGATVGILMILLTTWGWRHVLSLLPALSGVAVGLGGVLWFGMSVVSNSVTLILVLLLGQLAVIFLPIFRLSVNSLQEIRNRYSLVLQQLGAPSFFSLKRVYLKVGLKYYLAAAILGACWSAGEFSVASMVGPSQSTLPLYIQSLLGSYRLDEAALNSLTLLFLSGLSVLMLEVISYGMD